MTKRDLQPRESPEWRKKPVAVLAAGAAALSLNACGTEVAPGNTPPSVSSTQTPGNNETLSAPAPAGEILPLEELVLPEPLITAKEAATMSPDQIRNVLAITPDKVGMPGETPEEQQAFLKRYTKAVVSSYNTAYRFPFDKATVQSICKGDLSDAESVVDQFSADTAAKYTDSINSAVFGDTIGKGWSRDFLKLAAGKFCWQTIAANVGLLGTDTTATPEIGATPVPGAATIEDLGDGNYNTEFDVRISLQPPKGDPLGLETLYPIDQRTTYDLVIKLDPETNTWVATKIDTTTETI